MNTITTNQLKPNDKIIAINHNSSGNGSYNSTQYTVEREPDLDEAMRLMRATIEQHLKSMEKDGLINSGSVGGEDRQIVVTFL